MNKTLVKEIPFGKATARVTVSAFMYETELDGQKTGNTKLNISTKVDIIFNGKVVGSGYFAKKLEYGSLTDKIFDKNNLDPNKVYSRVGDRATANDGGKAADEINAAIDEMKASLEIEFKGESEAQKEEKREIEAAEEIVKAAEKEGVDNLMSAAQLQDWRKRYNDLHNEGGEGYIPTRISRESYDRATQLLQSKGLR